jgi:hypothetical protein
MFVEERTSSNDALPLVGSRRFREASMRYPDLSPTINTDREPFLTMSTAATQISTGPTVECIGGKMR